MELRIFEPPAEGGAAAAHEAARAIQAAIQEQGEANIVLATGTSQFEVLAALLTLSVDWSRVTAFHLDEYIGLPATHPASFRRYLKERFVDHVPALRAFHYIKGDAPDPQAECRRLGDLIRPLRIALTLLGIGENGHLAFNDPPADFETEEPYLVVTLDEVCRRQQLNEGWFPTLDAVPRVAISMSIRQIMKSETIVCSVPDLRKARIVKAVVEGPVTNRVPASILQQHPRCTLFMDRPAASSLTARTS